MIKKPSFLFSGIISGLGLIYWKDYIFENIIWFYLGQKENFEYKNFSDGVLVAELCPGKEWVWFKSNKAQMKKHVMKMRK